MTDANLHPLTPATPHVQEPTALQLVMIPLSDTRAPHGYRCQFSPVSPGAGHPTSGRVLWLTFERMTRLAAQWRLDHEPKMVIEPRDLLVVVRSLAIYTKSTTVITDVETKRRACAIAVLTSHPGAPVEIRVAQTKMLGEYAHETQTGTETREP